MKCEQDRMVVVRKPGADKFSMVLNRAIAEKREAGEKQGCKQWRGLSHAGGDRNQ